MRELEKLTPAECLLIDRRRRNETQAQAAQRMNISQNRYSFWERGLAQPDTYPKIKKLGDHEVCFLYRRRAGFTQIRVAKEIGCCKEWVKRMEQGNAPVGALIEYWEV